MSRPPRALAFAGMLMMLLVVGGDVRAEPFSFLPPGDLIEGSGQGVADPTVFAPGMRFPIENAPAYANSQVYNPGGYLGPGGGQCDDFNFSYPWRDNYCEKRSWDMPLCPAGTGHQGQDIRASSCEKDKHWAVATTDGTITHIGSYSVYLTADDGTRYDFLHMAAVQVEVGQEVTRGQHLGKVSNSFGGTPTTIHLHFNLRQNVEGIGEVYVPPYTSLLQAYASLVDTAPSGSLETVDCDMLVGWAFDSDLAAEAVDVNLGFAVGDETVTHAIAAELNRDDLCDSLGSCEHGFEVGSPLSLFDGLEHVVSADVDYEALATTIELGGSPQTMQCEPLVLSGVRRPVDVATFEQWSLSSFWDEAFADTGEVEALELAGDWPDEPLVVRGEKEADGYWLIDEGQRRQIADAKVARAWRLDLNSAELRTAVALEALPEGPALSARPVLLRDSDQQLFMLDAEPGAPATPDGGAGGSPALDGIPGSNTSAGCGCRVPRRTSGRGTPLMLFFVMLLVRGRAAGRARPRAK